MAIEINSSYNEIKITLSTVDDCTKLMSELQERSDLYNTVRDLRITFAECAVYNYRFVKWMEDYGADKINAYITSAENTDVQFKWSQLVMQELRMWVSIGKMVPPSEIDYYVERRGFDANMLEFILEGLAAIGLLGDASDEPVKQTNNECVMVVEELKQGIDQNESTN